MIINSKISASDEGAIKLETHDEAKLLLLVELEPNPYTGDTCFRLDSASASIQATGSIQISKSQFENFEEGWERNGGGELCDENGDSRIVFESTDSLGHFKVSISVGGPWSDQASISFETDQTAVTPFVSALKRLILR